MLLTVWRSSDTTANGGYKDSIGESAAIAIVQAYPLVFPRRTRSGASAIKSSSEGPAARASENAGLADEVEVGGAVARHLA